MYAKFPFSMENIPRQRKFGCFSLKFGCILTALLVIIFSLLGASQGIAELTSMPEELSGDQFSVALLYVLSITFVVVYAVSFVLSTMMLLGVLRDKPELIKPWVVFKSVQIIMSVLFYVYFNTMNMINQYADTSIEYHVIQFLSIVIRFYMLVLVASFYKQLVEDNEETEKLKVLIKGDTWYNEA